MSETCYLCGQASTLTSEHIIPQCLGGALEARIFCSACNSACGHDLDAALAKAFGRYATLLQLERDRGPNQPFTVVSSESGLKFTYDGKTLQRADPTVRLEKDDTGKVMAVEVIARSEKELKKIYEGIARKYNLDPGLGVFDSVVTPAPEGSHEFVLVLHPS